MVSTEIINMGPENFVVAFLLYGHDAYWYIVFSKNEEQQFKQEKRFQHQ